METKPVLLSTPQMIEAYWPQVAPLIAAAPVAEEFPPEVIKQLVHMGKMFCFVFTTDDVDGPTVHFTLIGAATPSDTYPVVNVICVAGKNIKGHINQHWDHFKGWCYMNGARAIDAYVPERMVKFTEKELGLKKESVHVRLRL